MIETTVPNGRHHPHARTAKCEAAYPNRDSPRTAIWLPSHPKLRSVNAFPGCTMSRTDSEGTDPNRYTPCSDPELPLPADLRSDSELPSCAKSSTAIEPPRRQEPRSDSVQPRFKTVQQRKQWAEPRYPLHRHSVRWERRTDSESFDPTRASPCTDAELPTRARLVLGLRSDSELPRYAKAKYGQRAPESTEAAKRQ